MAKKLTYEVGMDTTKAEKNLDNVKKGVDKVTEETKKLKAEEKKQADARKKQLDEQEKEQQALIDSIGIFGMTIGGLKQNLRGLKTASSLAFKTITRGIAMTGIGALLIAFTTLIGYFKNTVDGARQLEVIFAKVGATVSVLTDRVSKVGKALFGVFKKGGLKNLLKETKDAFTGINEEIQTEIKLYGDLKKAEIALRDAQRNLSVQFAEQRAELEELKLIAEDTTKTQEERVGAARKALDMETKMMNERVRQAEEELRIQQERMANSENTEEDLDREAQLLINLANIRQESTTKQIELNNKINSIEKEIQANRKAEQDEADRIAKEEADRKQKELEDTQKQKETELEILRTANMNAEQLEIDSATQKYNKLIELANKYGQDTAFITEQYNEQLKEIRDKYTEEEIDDTAQKNEALRQQRLQFAGSILSSIESIGATQTQKEISILDKAFQQGEISEAKYNKKKEQIERKALQREKKMAMFQLLVDTASAVSSGISGAMASATATGPAAVFTAPGFVASMIALALSSVAQGYAILGKVPGGGGSSSPDVNVSQDSGGEQTQRPTFNADALLGTATQTPPMEPVKAFVVESEVSDSQALQEELDFQTTL